MSDSAPAPMGSVRPRIHRTPLCRRGPRGVGRVWVPAAVLALALGSCSDGADEESPMGPGPSGSIGVTLQPTSLELEAGEAGTVSVTVSRSGGFEGAVTLTIEEGLPSGAQATFSPSLLPAGSISSQLQIATGSAAPGESQVVVRAHASGLEPRTVTLSLTIAEPSPEPDFSLEVVPFESAIPAGTSGGTTVRIERENFTGIVTLTVSGAPEGVSASVAPTSVIGDEATLIMDVGSGVTEGSYGLTVTGEAEGIGERAAEVAFQVAPPPPPGDGVTFSFCASFAPEWLAYQDRDGPWTQAAPAPGTDVTMPIEGRGGVAWSYRLAGGADIHLLHLLYASVEELNVLGEDWCAHWEGRKEVSGTLVGLDIADAAFVGVGSSVTYVTGDDPDFTLLTVPDGTRDLVATRNLAAGPGGGGPATFPDRVILRRSLDPANGATLPAVDFGAGEAFEPLTQEVSVGNVAGEALSATVVYHTGNRTRGTLYIPPVSAGTTHLFPAIPPAHQQAGDIHLLNVGTEGVEVGDRNYSRFSAVAFRDASDQSVELGPVPASPTVTTVATSPYLRIRVQTPREQEYGDLFAVHLNTLQGAFVLMATEGYFGGSPPASWDFTAPDLTPAGYDASRGPHLGGFFGTWGVWTSGYSGGGTERLQRPVEGLRQITGIWAGALP